MSILILAFIISFGTMFFGAISGGVGLVLRPLLIFIGFPAIAVIGSVRVAAVIGELPGIFLLNKHKKIDWKLVLFLVIPMFLGSFIAGVAVLSILKGALEKIMGIVLLIVGIILIIHKKAGLEEHNFHISKIRNVFGFIGTIIISFFNTITGGMGPMFSSLYIANYGKTYINASALAKTTSYIGAGLASIVFIFGKAVDWQLFVALVLGFALGSRLGVHYGLKKGDRWIKILVLIVVFASAIKLIFFGG